MKFIAILLTCATVCWALEDKCQGKELRTVIEMCVLEKGAAEVDVTDLTARKPARNDVAKCFRSCLFDKCQYLTPDGKFKEDTPTRLANILHGGDKSKIPDIEKAGKKCLATPITDNTCDTVEAYIVCIITECADCNLKFYNVFD